MTTIAEYRITVRWSALHDTIKQSFELLCSGLGAGEVLPLSLSLSSFLPSFRRGSLSLSLSRALEVRAKACATDYKDCIEDPSDPGKEDLCYRSAITKGGSPAHASVV